MRASAACLGVSNCFCPGCAAEAASDIDGVAACKPKPNNQKLTIAEAISVNFAEVIILSVDFILVSLIHSSFLLSPASASTATASASTASTASAASTAMATATTTAHASAATATATPPRAVAAAPHVVPPSAAAGTRVVSAAAAKSSTLGAGTRPR